MFKNTLSGVLGSVAVLSVLVFAGCAGGEGEGVEPESTLETTEQELIVCGPLCPPGYTQLGFACSTGCAGGCPNAVSCSPTPSTANIWGTPQTVTVPAGASHGTSKICWNTSGLPYPVWIKVSANGAAEQLFTKESDPGQACIDATWIGVNQSYVFSIRTAKTGGSVLATTTVYGVAAP
ncbi:hypothetical protein [Pyxidicoccus xibeiensis]|uniref:hypothetical protein n=1 Tax=Pyxidicoccus xibeiensis TaxID=2906759 RepID=UPI0020A7BF95|nr:hypothetical protein [Pyxidicoccus xibeiensis]MCP3142768.1 hypothetical protein [Pyxidicoccus xibeiensis]